MTLQLVQFFYWLALATWFGGAMFIVIAFRVVFKTVQENRPILPQVLSVNLEGQHSTLLAGTIMGKILTSFLRVELGCGAVLAISLCIQAAMLDLHDQDVLIRLILNAVLLLGSAGVVVYDWRVVWPRMWLFREQFLEHADEPEIANPAKDEFDRYQQTSARLLQVLLFLLLGMVLFSVGPVQQQVTQVNPAEAVHGASR